MRIGTRTIRIAGRTVPFRVRHSRRARRLRLEYTLDSGVLAVLPRWAGRGQMERFLQEREAWLRAQVERTAPVDDAFPFRPLVAGCRVLYLGRPHILRAARTDRSRVRGERRGGIIRLELPREDEADLEEVLERWYRTEARRRITDRTGRWARRLGLEVEGVSIRDQRRRWGSCSSRRRLSFNWRLVLAPPLLIDYVIVHELTHLEVMDHSPRYWSRVAERCPGYEAFETWLDTYGPALTLHREPDLRRPAARLQPPAWGGPPG